MKSRLIANECDICGTNEPFSFALESEINVGDIYTFDSTFVPLEKTTDIFIDTVKAHTFS